MYKKAIKAVSVLKKGSSRPIIVIDELGDKYLVKLRHSLSNPYSSVCDYIACKIGFEMGLPVINPVLMQIDESILFENINYEGRMTIEKSRGWNIAYPFYENSVDVELSNIPIDSPLLKDLFRLDLFLLNIDRVNHNTNIIKVEQKYWSFDYETAFLILGILHEKDYSLLPSVLKSLRQHILYFHLTAEDFTWFLSCLKHVNIKNIIEYIPEDWLTSLQKVQLEKGIINALNNEKKYLEMIETIDTFPIVTEEMRKKQALENRLNFEKKVGKLW